MQEIPQVTFLDQNTKRQLIYSLTPEQQQQVSDHSRPKRVRTERVAPRYRVADFPLPEFSKKAKKLLSRGGVRLLSGPVIKEAAYHLEDLIKRPTPTEYSNYVDALFVAHPNL